MLYQSFLICDSPHVQPCCALQRGDTANFLLFVCIQTTFLQEQSNGGWLNHAYKK
jgi:hypothetical protein